MAAIAPWNLNLDLAVRPMRKSLHKVAAFTPRLTKRVNLSVPQLVEQSLSRVDALIAEGICVIEIKSGYGLDTQTELNMLRAARQIGKERPITVKTSFLGAHLAPTTYRDHPERYLNEICIPALEKAADEGLVDAVDGFCENIAFSAVQLERLFNRAESLGLPVKIHAEQLSNCGGARLAAKYHALSADHLEYANETDVVALKKSDTVAVLLPGRFLLPAAISKTTRSNTTRPWCYNRRCNGL